MMSLLLLAAAAVCPHVVKDEVVATCYEFPPFDALAARREEGPDGVRYTYRTPLRTKDTHLVLVLNCAETELTRTSYVRATDDRWARQADAASMSAEDFLTTVADDLKILDFSRCNEEGR